MKTKKRIYTVLLLSLLASLCLLCFGIRGVYKASAEDIPTTESTVAPEEQVTTEELTTADVVAKNWDNAIKAWIDTIVGGTGVLLDTLLIVVISKKKDPSVAVTVNDSTTQSKLDSLQLEYTNLRKILIDLFQLTKGTLDVLVTLYSDNKSLDDAVRDTIKTISLNSEDIIKDVSDIINAETHKAAKTALQNISNIVLG